VLQLLGRRADVGVVADRTRLVWRHLGLRCGVAAFVLLLQGCTASADHGGAARVVSGSPVSGDSSQRAGADPCAAGSLVVTRHEPPGGPLRTQDEASGVGPFAGSWYVHDGWMVLRPDGTGTQSFNAGALTAEVDTVALTYYRNPDRLLVQVMAVSWQNGDTASSPRVPADACSQAGAAPGDEELLRFAAPHLLVASVIVSHRPLADLAGANPYWCQDGLATELQNSCGA
jgi:hypothetical protein